MEKNHLFNLHSVQKQIKELFKLGSLNDLDIDHKVDFTERYFTIIADTLQNEWADIEKLDDARLAGTKKADKCTLILTEGDSAKAMAIAGISVIPDGRDLYGIYPLRGKLLNTRDKKEKEIANFYKLLFVL